MQSSAIPSGRARERVQLLPSQLLPRECPAEPSCSGHSENPAQARSLPGQTPQPDVDPRDSRGWPDGSSLGCPNAAPQALQNVDPKGLSPEFVFISFFSPLQERIPGIPAPCAFPKVPGALESHVLSPSRRGILQNDQPHSKRKPKNKDEAEGRKSPSFMDGKKRAINPKQTPCAPGLAGGL